MNGSMLERLTSVLFMVAPYLQTAALFALYQILCRNLIAAADAPSSIPTLVALQGIPRG